MATTLHLLRVNPAIRLPFTHCSRLTRNFRTAIRTTTDREAFKVDPAACKRCATDADIALPRKAPPAVEIGELPEDAVGECPICEADIKLTQKGERPGRLVHHGYARPGDGMIHGDCYAVGYEPYEVSPQACIDYLPGLVRQRDGAADYLAKLQVGLITYFRLIANRTHPIEWVEYVAGVTHPSLWHRLIEADMQETTARIASLNRAIARISDRISTWVVKPLRTGAHLAVAKGLTVVEQRKQLQTQPGFRCAAKTSHGKHWVVVYSAAERKGDTTDGRWLVVCTEHASRDLSQVTAKNERQAREFMQRPATFCESCQALAARKVA